MAQRAGSSVQPNSAPSLRSPHQSCREVPGCLQSRWHPSEHPALSAVESPSWKKHSRDIPSVWSRDLE